MTYKCTIYNKEYNLNFYKTKYVDPENTAIIAMMEDGEMYGYVSRNLIYGNLSEDEIFMDMNNSSQLCKAMIKDGLLKPTGESVSSGYCVYPVARITDKLKKILNIIK